MVASSPAWCGCLFGKRRWRQLLYHIRFLFLPPPLPLNRLPLFQARHPPIQLSPVAPEPKLLQGCTIYSSVLGAAICLELVLQWRSC